MSNPLTPNEQILVNQARNLMPDIFQLGANDDKLLAFVNLTIQDWNVWPPLTGATVDSVVASPQLTQIILFGVCFFAALFQQMNASLQDFNFSDQGFTVQVDQTGKIQQSLNNLAEVYKRMIKQYKTWYVLESGPLAITTPRYQSQLGQFLKLSLGCFLPNTKVFTSNGWKFIQDIEIGNKVLSHDGKFHEVITVYPRKYSGFIQNIIIDEKLIRVTENHHILSTSKNNWKPAKEFAKGDGMFDVGSGSLSNVKNVDFNIQQFYTGLVFDLEVADSHTYNAEGFAVHNSAFTWNSP